MEKRSKSMETNSSFRDWLMSPFTQTVHQFCSLFLFFSDFCVVGKCCGILLLLLLLPSGEENYSAAAYFSVLVTFFSFFRNSGENTCVSVATATTPTPPRKRGVNTDLPPSLVFSHATENSRNCSCGIRPYLHFPSPCQKKRETKTAFYHLSFSLEFFSSLFRHFLPVWCSSSLFLCFPQKK